MSEEDQLALALRLSAQEHQSSPGAMNAPATPSTMSEEDQLALALRLSAQEHRSSLTAPIAMTSAPRVTKRSNYKRGDAKRRAMKPTPGDVVQINTLNQFHKDVSPLIKKHRFPSAACGAFAVANALHIATELPSRLRDGVLDQKGLDAVVAALRNPGPVLVTVDRIMKFIHDSRAAYIAKHASSFPTERARDKYMRDWVANFEISDFLIAEAKRSNTMMRRVAFVRYNQWPERAGAKHEEAERLVEERPFGGQKTGDKASVALEAGASRFIIEPFAPKRELLRPEKWASSKSAQKIGGVFVLDVNGHFVTAFSCLFGESKSPRLIVVNTTSANYLSNGAPCAAYDAVFDGLARRDRGS